jgi:hypothetical protein
MVTPFMLLDILPRKYILEYIREFPSGVPTRLTIQEE